MNMNGETSRSDGSNRVKVADASSRPVKSELKAVDMGDDLRAIMRRRRRLAGEEEVDESQIQNLSPSGSKNDAAKETLAISPKVRKLVKSLQTNFLLTLEPALTLLDEVDALFQNQNITDSQPRHMVGFVHAQGIPPLVQLMNKFSEEESFQLRSCKLLLRLASSTESRRVGTTDGCLQAILVAMLKHYHIVELQEVGCELLANLSSCCQEEIVSMSGIEVTLTAMQTYSDNVTIQAEGCCVMAGVASSVDNESAVSANSAMHVAACGGIKAIAAAALNHKNNRSVNYHVCRAIRYLTAVNDSNRGSVASTGGVRWILLAASRFGRDEALVEEACTALQNLTLDHKPNAEDTMQQEDGLATIVAVVGRHTSVVGIQRAGCGILHNLSNDDRHSEIIGANGGIDCVLTAMRNFEKDDTVQREGCDTLCNLAAIPQNVPAMTQSGGIGVIVMAMKQLGDNLGVQKKGFQALQSLAATDQNKVSIAAAGGITVIISAMKRYEDNAAVQGLAVRTLDTLAGERRTKVRMQTDDIIHTIFLAVQSYPTNVFLQDVGRKLLLMLDPTRLPSEGS